MVRIKIKYCLIEALKFKYLSRPTILFPARIEIIKKVIEE